MKKIWFLTDHRYLFACVEKFVKVMKICIFLIAFATLQSYAIDNYAQTKRMDMKIVDESIVSTLEKIEGASEFFFFYNNKVVKLDKKISIDLKDKTINEILDFVFEGTDIEYTVNNRQIILSGKESSGLPGRQQKSVSGRVTDSSGASIPGVSVIVKGTTKGFITDANGNYNISNISDGAVLLFSFIGLKSQEIAVENKTVINVSLAEEAIGVDEVVVVGYGVQKKVNVIGSIAQMSSKQLTDRPVVRLSNALTGGMSGVTVISRNGKPGSGDGQIRVRGVGSFGAEPSALIVVDGVPLVSISAGDLAPQASEGQEAQPYGGASSGDINSINPNDIESVSVLKDAASAAIYGSRAANGVILITTKKGKSGKARITYNSYVGVQSPTSTPRMANSVDYANAMNRAAANTYSAQQIETLRTSGPSNNWIDQVLSGSGFTQQHNVSIVGGQKSNSYFVSFGYLDQNGVVQKTNYNRYNTRVNLSAEILKNVTLSVQLAGVINNRTEPNVNKARNGAAFPTGAEALLFGALQMAPNVLEKAANGDWGAGNRNQGTPASWLASNSFRATPSKDINSGVNLSWAPLKGLTLTGMGSYAYTAANFTGFQASQVLFPAVAASLNSTLWESVSSKAYKTAQALAEYQFTIKEKHDFNLLAGYSFESNVASSLQGVRQNVPNNYLVLDMGSSANMVANGNTATWAMQSEFIRFKYDYDQKYLFEATIRCDASSRFPVDKRYAYFPSFAAGWRVSQEKFFQKLQPVFSNFKLKASWGELGNQNIGDYPYQQVYSSGFNYPFGDAINTGVALATYKDPLLHWETSRTFDLGLETGFFKNTLLFNFSYFNKNTFNILYSPNASISKVIGASVGQINTGSLQNNGVEVELAYQNKIGDLNFGIKGNFTYIENKVTSLGVGAVRQPNGYTGAGGGPYDQNLFIGYPLQMYYGYETDGVFLPSDFVNGVASWPDQKLAAAKATYVPKPGDIRYVDISGPDGVPDGRVDPTYDKTYLGSRIPKINYGFNINLDYKGFDMAVFLQGVAKVQGILNRNMGWGFYNTGSIQEWQITDSYNSDNPQRYPKYPRLEAIVGGPDGNYQTSSFWVLNGSYLRIKNLQLGYSLPQNIVKKIGLEKFRIYVSGENLFTFADYRPGWDPEINTVGNGFFYPILKTYTLGVNINF
jgi:TonB-linked SusC/RagA family outer membrane protein